MIEDVYKLKERHRKKLREALEDLGKETERCLKVMYETDDDIDCAVVDLARKVEYEDGMCNGIRLSLEELDE